MQRDYPKQSNIAEGGIPLQRHLLSPLPCVRQARRDLTCGDMRVVQPARSKNTRYPWEARFKLRLDGALSNLIE